MFWHHQTHYYRSQRRRYRRSHRNLIPVPHRSPFSRLVQSFPISQLLPVHPPSIQFNSESTEHRSLTRLPDDHSAHRLLGVDVGGGYEVARQWWLWLCGAVTTRPKPAWRAGPWW